MPPEAEDLILRALDGIERMLADLKRDVQAGLRDHETRIRALEDDRRDRDAAANVQARQRIVALNWWQQLAAIVAAVGGALGIARLVGLL